VAELGRSLPEKPLFLVLLILWVGLFQFLGNATFGYTDTASLFRWLENVYVHSSEDEYGLLVPIVVLVLLVVKRRELIPLPKSRWWPALGFVVAGLLLHLLGYVIQQTRISLVGFLLGLYGLTGLIWGRQWMRATLFPYFLLIFCVPLGAMTEAITFPLRLMATKITTGVAGGVLGIPVAQNGTSIWNPSGRYQYEVAAACSGLRSLMAIFALATIYGFLDFRKTWQRLVLVASAFPLAVAGNVARLLTIIITAELFGQSAGNYVHENHLFNLLPYVPPILGLLVLGRFMDRRGSPVAPAWEAKAA
jgi:exosortase